MSFGGSPRILGRPDAPDPAAEFHSNAGPAIVSPRL